MYAKSIFSFFYKYIREYKWYYLAMLSAPLLASFYPFAYNYAIKLFLDAMTESEIFSYQEIAFPIGLFIITQFALDLVWRLSNIAEWKSEPHVRRLIILDSYNYVQHHSYKYFQDNFTGAICSRIKAILDGYDTFWAEMHHGLFAKLLKVIVSITTLAFVNIYLGLFFTAWCCIYTPVMYQLSKKLNSLVFKEIESRHTIIGRISDNLSNISALFSYSARKRELKSLDSYVSTTFMNNQLKFYKYSFFVQIIGGLFYLVVFSVLIFYVIHLKMQGQITIGDFAFIFGMALVVAEDLWQVTTSLQDFSRAMGDLKSALSILNLPQSERDLPEAKPIKIVKPQINFENITFSYDNESHTGVFENLNLSIKAGEKIGLAGHSGSGKSSLVSLLLRYFTPESGKITVDGQDIKYISQDSLRGQIAVIPQDTILLNRTLLENIRFGRPDASDEEIVAASKAAHIHDFIMTLPDQYNTEAGERGLKLSGGQRQRVSIARAILKDAPILILDEATSALDSYTEQLIQESLSFFMQDPGKTVIAIAHRFSTLKYMDRIIVLDKGLIIEEGTHDELIKADNSLYKELWEYQRLQR